ncbi:unnamed protein product [Dimorphilus gyrociliatus]|uniref:Uncharacterized protein n=1 Tax=Dimorphilus gyrociliatus TaxID=2664684 RepID=A0A7I8W3M2_9ANNE|nr:unnamed protein product [Dimorphilus gyrociliatus]
MIWLGFIGLTALIGPHRVVHRTYELERKENLAWNSFKINNGGDDKVVSMENGRDAINKAGGDERFLVFECGLSNSPCNGWGNRIAGIFNAYILSVISNRTFAIHLREPCDLVKYFLPNKINWYRKFPQKVDVLYSGASIQSLSSGAKFQLYDNLFNKSLTVISVKFFTYHSIHYMKHNNQFKKRFIEMGFDEDKIKSMTFFNLPFNENIFDLLFRLTPEIEYQVNKYFDKKTKMICAHIRTGNDGEVLKPYHVQVRENIEFIGKFIQEQSERDEYKTADIYIATDSTSAIAKLSKFIKKPLLTSEGSIVNIKRIKINGSTPSTQKACDGLRKVILDWYILSNCNNVIRAPGSTFSGTAMIRKRYSEVFKFVYWNNKPSFVHDDLFM